MNLSIHKMLYKDEPPTARFPVPILCNYKLILATEVARI